MNNNEYSMPLSTSIKLLFVGNALNIVVPAGLGDILKSYFGYLWTGMKERMLSVSISDKFIAIGSLFFLSVYSFIFYNQLLILIVGILCLIPIAIIIFSRQLAIKKFFEKIFIELKLYKLFNISFSEVVNSFDFSSGKLFFSFALSIVAWCVTYFLLFLSFRSVGMSISFEQVLVYAPVLTLVRLFPLTLNGIGSDEATIVYLFSKFESNSQNILIGALIYRIVLMVIPAIFGVMMIITTKRTQIYE